MKKMIFFAALLGLSNCAEYTDKVSPCVGKDKTKIVTRSAFSSTQDVNGPFFRISSSNCDYRSLNQ